MHVLNYVLYEHSLNAAPICPKWAAEDRLTCSQRQDILPTTNRKEGLCCTPCSYFTNKIPLICLFLVQKIHFAKSRFMISGFSAFLPVFSQIFIHTWFRAHIYYQRRDASYLKTMKTRQQRQAISDLQTKKKKSTRSRVSATTEDDDDLETSPRKKVLRSGRAKRKLTKKKSNRRVSGSSLSSTSSPFKKQKTSPKKNILKIPSGLFW